MARLGLETEIVDERVYEATVRKFREAGQVLPTFAELATPDAIAAEVQAALAEVAPDAAKPLNLFRVHWHNSSDRRSTVATPGYVVLPEKLTGVAAPIFVLLGDRFPMIHAHKVLAAYACLVPRLVTGQFDPNAHRAIWPSTGNYCRGGVAISRILGCRGVAVLPEGMSEERFEWLENWVTEPTDIIRTVGSESNVKEIYDKCALLDAEDTNIIFNQFCEFGNHLAHYLCTGRAAERVFRAEASKRPSLRLAAFVSATGSAGTIGAGDYLKDQLGAKIVAVEALECPTMLYNGFGEHNIQGIGDKHIPFIHNVTNTDLVTAISDRSTDSLNLLFNSAVGKTFLGEEQGLDSGLLEDLTHLGLSSICNVLAAIKTAKELKLGAEDAIVTVATDGAQMYDTELDKATDKLFAGKFGRAAAAKVWEEHLRGVDTSDLLVLSDTDRNRIFNLGYFTWVEQQGVSLKEFECRRGQEFWRGLRDLIPIWDTMIADFNGETRVG